MMKEAYLGIDVKTAAELAPPGPGYSGGIEVERAVARRSRTKVLRVADIATPAACAGLFIWVAALPPFHTGLWFLTEPVEVALYLSGALCAAALVVLALCRVPVGAVLRDPLVLLPILLGVVSILLSLFTAFPARSWFGPPQTGEGALWFVVLGLQIAVFRLAGAEWLRGAAMGGAAFMLLLTLAGQPLNSFPDYLAFVGIGLAIAVPGWAALGLGAICVVASASKGAILLAPVLAIAGLCRAPRRTLCLLAPFAAMFAIDCLDMMPSAWSRTLLWRVSWNALASDPMIWLHGLGWGSFNDMLLNHRHVALALDPTWEGGWWRGAWHSHNLIIEALLSVGIAGPILVLAPLVVAAGRSIGLRAGLWAALAAVSAIWMPTPHALPFVALAFASVGRTDAGHGLSPRWTVALMFLPAVWLLFAALLALSMAISAERTYRGVMAGAVPLPHLASMGRGGDHLWQITVNELARLHAASAGRPLADDEVKRLNALIAIVDTEIAAGHAGDRLRRIRVPAPSVSGAPR